MENEHAGSARAWVLVSILNSICLTLVACGDGASESEKPSLAHAGSGGATNAGGSAPSSGGAGGRLVSSGGATDNGGSGSSAGNGGAPESGGAAGSAGTLAPSFCLTLDKSGDWTSSRVSYGADGKLRYVADSEQNRIPDFSHAGYRYGEVDPPQIPEASSLSATSGDQTKRIQDALDELGSRTPDVDGFRGALLLAPGRYEIHGTLRIRQSGVVLRGSGDGSDPERDTILVAKGDSPHQRTVVIVGSGNSSPWKEGQGSEVTDDFVQVSSLSVNVANAGLFSVGDAVLIKHPSTQAWIDAVNGGGVVSDAKWTAFSKDIPYYRTITNIENTRLEFDAPIYVHLDRRLATATVHKATLNTVERVGLEDLRVDIETKGGEDENHAWDAVGVVGAEDAWVRNVTVLHFGHAGVFTSGARKVTIMESVAIDPVGIRTGGRFYNFDAEARSQLVLFKNCEAAGGRHDMIVNGTQSASGIVFYRHMASAGSASEGHRHFPQALLFDSLTDAGTTQLINRGDYGTSHGWGAAHSVIWNSTGTMNVQKPPTSQNYAISSAGKISTRDYFPGARGFTELKAGKLAPASLYEAQLCERLGF